MLSHRGKLKINRSAYGSWGYIEVEKNLWTERRKKHLVVPSLWELPGYSPHISVFCTNEIFKIPRNFNLTEDIEFTLSNKLVVLNPSTWKDVSEVAFEPIYSNFLCDLRKSFGFSSYMYGNHEFHLTLGIKLADRKSKRK